ncbi:peptidoglycan-binding protein [Evtepia sp.]|uniref:peptidoglycan-binding protein n=1 Tax=Evtepia sp. TaxID=2773933 RepID=UPI003F15C060
MPISVVPYIPTYITVHLGTPSSSAENVTVPFIDYIKNVASSEIYPTWHYSSLRANILAQVSFALNRVYTEFYPSQGYDFNITSTTAYDQRFIKDRTIFDSVSQLVDELFDDYIRREGYVEPLSAKFCNGTTTQCDGLSQWGSEYLAQEGTNSMDILRTYYGDDIELVVNAPIQDIQYSYPGTAMRRGERSPDIRIAQFMLNRISQAYPAIPKIPIVDGFFGPQTEAAVRQFQKIFNLTSDGIIGKGTWYTMVRLYSGLLRLSELVSEGQPLSQLNFDYEEFLSYGQQSQRVAFLQYLLSVLSQFYTNIPFVTIDGVYGPATRQAVMALQRDAGLPQTGSVSEATWDAIVERFLSIDRTVLASAGLTPFRSSLSGELTPEEIQESLVLHPNQFPGRNLEYGQTD